MKLIKCSLLLIVGFALFTPKVFADNLDNVPLATLKQRMNHGDENARIKYYQIKTSQYKNKSIEELEKMANAGDDYAAKSLGDDYFLGENGALQDFFKAKEWYEKAINLGDKDSISAIAMLYLDGKGVPQDVPKAIKLFELSANKGQSLICLILAGIYSNPTNEYKSNDPVKARKWLEKAAQYGSKDALLLLGITYENGNGVVQDKEKAKEYYKQACLKKEQAGCSGYKRLNN